LYERGKDLRGLVGVFQGQFFVSREAGSASCRSTHCRPIVILRRGFGQEDDVSSGDDLIGIFGENRPERFMELALTEARRAVEVDEVPVGAVIVDNETGRVVAKAHNQRETLQDPTAHAEVIAITQAAAHYGSWRLTEATLYVTLEPCLMCSGAIVLSRLPVVVYGAVDPKAGAHRSVYDVLENEANNHVPKVTGGILSGASAQLLRDFFRSKRGRKPGPGPSTGANGVNGTNGTNGNDSAPH